MAEANESDLSFIDDIDEENHPDVEVSVKTDRNAQARRLLEIKREERALNDALRDYYDY